MFNLVLFIQVSIINHYMDAYKKAKLMFTLIIHVSSSHFLVLVTALISPIYGMGILMDEAILLGCHEELTQTSKTMIL